MRKVKMKTISAGPDGVRYRGKSYSLSPSEAKDLVDAGCASYETAMTKTTKKGDLKAAQKIEDARLAEEAHTALIEKATELRIEITDDMDDEYIQLAVDEVEALSPQEKAARTRELNKSEGDKLEEARKAACEGCEKLPDGCVGVKDCEKFDDDGVPVPKTTSSSWS